MEDSSFVDKAMSLSLPGKKELVYKLTRSIIRQENAVSAQERYDVIKSIVEMVTGHTIEDKSRTRDNVKCRMYIAYLMHKDGYSFTTIGSVMHKNHATMVHLNNLMKDMLSVPSMYKVEIAELNQIEFLLNGTEDN